VTGRSGLFLLAVDHRQSFERLFGIDGPVAEHDRARLTGAKALVAEALGDVAVERGSAANVDLGILIDDLYGGAAIAVARRTGVSVALAFERSGQTILEFEHDDWRDRLAAHPPDFVKVLIRHRVDGDVGDIAVQLDRLGQIADACAKSPAGFLLELLTPYTEAECAASSTDELEVTVRPRLVVDAIRQIQEAGVNPDVWKVEGVADPAGCAAIAAAARRDGRENTGVVVLGAGAGVSTVNRWLAAAATAGYSGFAVGRSIWSDAILAHDRGGLDAGAARAQIASRYTTFIDTFEDALRASRPL
jgi:myo-inositol catabolism protein IolC